MNNFKYDFDRGGGGNASGRRLRFITIFAAVLAVTGGIVYYLIPRDTPAAPRNGTDNQISEVGGNTAPSGVSAVPRADVADIATTSVGDAANPEVSPNAPDDADAATSTTPPATETPEKGKPWSGDAPEAPKPASPDADADLKLTETKLKPLYDGDASAAAKLLTVAPGDSLSRIAARNHTTVEALRRYNDLKNDTIRIGQKLRVIPGPWRITVDKARRELILERAENGEWRTFGRFQVGLGRMDRTPEADFAISTRLRHPDWYAPDGRIFRYGDAGNQLGDYFLKLASVGNPDKPLRGFGIHGTGDDATVGRNWSNGCVRMHNRDVELLYYLVPSGTPVRIVPGAGETGKAEKRDE